MYIIYTYMYIIHSHRQYANAKEEDFEAPMKKKLVCDAKKLLAEGHVPKNK